jgi:uncharacterized protein (TIGR01777 family)
MRVLVTGGTGFIGRALIPLLQRESHSLVAWVRSERRLRDLPGANLEFVRADLDSDTLAHALAGCDGIINLAGEPLIGKRWTAARRQVLEASRIQLTDRLVRAMEITSPRPRVLISSSAVGFYGDRGDERLTEASRPGDDFLSQLCQRWEAAAARAELSGVRVVTLRMGVVLGSDGGALARMLPPFRFGLGGPIGSGRQYLPWIHLHDLNRIIARALVDERFRGPLNGVAPEPATSRTFAKALGAAVARPAWIPVPALALRTIFGEAATVLLSSQRVEPDRLTALGFTWDFPTLDGALHDILTARRTNLSRSSTSV